jgi:hypothetical protein
MSNASRNKQRRKNVKKNTKASVSSAEHGADNAHTSVGHEPVGHDIHDNVDNMHSIEPVVASVEAHEDEKTLSVAQDVTDEQVSELVLEVSRPVPAETGSTSVDVFGENRTEDVSQTVTETKPDDDVQIRHVEPEMERGTSSLDLHKSDSPIIGADPLTTQTHDLGIEDTSVHAEEIPDNREPSHDKQTYSTNDVLPENNPDVTEGVNEQVDEHSQFALDFHNSGQTEASEPQKQADIHSSTTQDPHSIVETQVYDIDTPQTQGSLIGEKNQEQNHHDALPWDSKPEAQHESLLLNDRTHEELIPWESRTEEELTSKGAQNEPQIEPQPEQQQEELLPSESKAEETQEQFLWDSVTEETKNPLPWESRVVESNDLLSREPHSEQEQSSLPWESKNDAHVEASHDALMPSSHPVEGFFDENVPQTTKESQEKDTTVALTKEADESYQFTPEVNNDLLPWESETSGQNPPGQNPSGQNPIEPIPINPSTEQMPWETNNETNSQHFSQWESSSEQATKSTSQAFDADSTASVVFKSRDTLDESSKEKLPWEKESSESEAKPKQTLDQLFLDDDLDESFVNEISNSEKAGTSKLDDLDLELDDDLLLDDEFLEEPQVVIEQPKKTIKQSYLPSAQSVPHYSPIQTNPNELNFKQELETKKKKSDAYDFPDTLIANKIRPAPRSANSKYISNKNSPPVSTTTVSTPTPSRPVEAAVTSKSSIGSVPQKTFFEDLPIDMPKVAPRRTGSHKSTMNPHSSPVVTPSLPPTPATTKPAARAPPVNPYMPQKQASIPSVSSTQSYSPQATFAQPSIPSQRQTSHYAPPDTRQSQHAQPSGFPSTLTPVGAVPPQNQMQPFPSVQNYSGNQNFGISNLASNNLPQITTTVPKSQSTTSPYVPTAGPYGPANHQRTHSRGSSLVGGSGKEVNPYVPILPTVQGNGPQASNIPSAPNRMRGLSNPRANIYKSQQTSRPLDPSTLLKRQFPIFNWSLAKNVVYMIPTPVNPHSNYLQTSSPAINIMDATSIFKDINLYETFPGPLIKGKTKQKDLEKWLVTNADFLAKSKASDPDEVLLSRILLSMLQHDRDTNFDDFSKAVCSELNPTIDYYSDMPFDITSGSSKIGTNSFKLDTAGVNTVFSLFQLGQISKALDFTVSKGDWALALVIANFSGPEVFGRIASEFARNSFPFQKSNNKVQHLMPMLLKIFAGDINGLFQDLNSVSTEGEYAILHWREIVSSVLISGAKQASHFVTEFGKFLSLHGNTYAAEICYILVGLPLSQVVSSSGVLFPVVNSKGTSSMYTEIYEFILCSKNSSLPSFGFPHLLLMKLKQAAILADYGLFLQSQRYIDHINTIIKSLGNKSPFISPTVIHEFQKLIVRVSESGEAELGWFGGKIGKVNLDKVWGQLDKFIGGEEPKQKGGEANVFNNFSPSVSRNASTVDISTMNTYYQLPLAAPPHVGMPAPDSSFSPAAKPGLNRVGSMPNVPYSHGKYTPAGNHQAASKPTSHLQRDISTIQSRSSFELNNPKFAPPKSTTHNYNNEQTTLSPARKTMPRHAQDYTKPPIVMNASNMNSTSSLASTPAQPISMYAPPMHQQKRNSQVSLNSESLALNESHPGSHNRTSSMQSDMSMEYKPELKPSPRFTKEAEGMIQKDVLHVDEPIEEEISELQYSNRMPEEEAHERDVIEPPRQEIIPDVSVVNDEISKTGKEKSLTEDQQTLPPPPPPTSKPPGTAVKNPYAPDASASRSRRGPSKYGPPSGSSANKYAVPENLKQDAPPGSDVNESTGINDMFAFGGYQAGVTPVLESTDAKIEEKAKSEEQTDDKNEGSLQLNTNDTPVEKEVSQSVSAQPVPFPPVAAPPINHGIPRLPDVNATVSRTPLTESAMTNNSDVMAPVKEERFAPPKSAFATKHSPVANIDDSFDSDFDANGSNPIQTPKPRESVLNSPLMLDSLQDGKISGLDTSFGFPIPGSPESTTRANSVFGGPSGFFSSRLSQSHQSQLYEQYEVTDDTVKDYVPLVEEDEEDEENEPVQQKVQEQPKSKKTVPKESPKKTGDQSVASGGGFLKWFGRDDGKPKPIRAKLGEKVNPIYYDEKLKRYINRNIPLEEQLKASAPPPPPKMAKSSNISPSPVAKGPPTASSSNGPPAASSSNGPLAVSSPNGPPTASNLNGPPSASSLPSSEPKKTPSSTPSLATAGLDDLLDLNNMGARSRKPRKGARRNYINVMDKS